MCELNVVLEVLHGIRNGISLLRENESIGPEDLGEVAIYLELLDAVILMKCAFPHKDLLKLEIGLVDSLCLGFHQLRIFDYLLD